VKQNSSPHSGEAGHSAATSNVYILGASSTPSRGGGRLPPAAAQLVSGVMQAIPLRPERERSLPSWLLSSRSTRTKNGGVHPPFFGAGIITRASFCVPGGRSSSAASPRVLLHRLRYCLLVRIAAEVGADGVVDDPLLLFASGDIIASAVCAAYERFRVVCPAADRCSERRSWQRAASSRALA
jgi:hypothetical protein